MGVVQQCDKGLTINVQGHTIILTLTASCVEALKTCPVHAVGELLARVNPICCI